jgi:hypothetical protein
MRLVMMNEMMDYTGNAALPINNLIGGFSMWGLVGTTIFGGIGFIAFVYGKKNSEWKPMVIGILLCVYPYFFKSTLSLYLVGLALTVALRFI